MDIDTYQFKDTLQWNHFVICNKMKILFHIIIFFETIIMVEKTK